MAFAFKLEYEDGTPVMRSALRLLSASITPLAETRDRASRHDSVNGESVRA
jgi:hypothetical protein